MFNPRILVAVLAALIVLPSLALGEVHYFDVDPSHSEVRFKIRHLVAKVPGRFDDFSGKVSFDPENIGKTFVISGVVKTSSVNTANEKRDGHLKSPDFFATEKYPEITVTSKSVKKAKGDHFIVVADITIRGVTKLIELETEVAGVGTNPFTGTPTTGIEMKGRLNRKDFGMTWNKALDAGGFVLDDMIDVSVLIEATVPPEQS